MNRPHLIDLPKIGASDIGYITVADVRDIPFEIKRCYWTFYTPESVVRGNHAHIHLRQVYIAVAGKIEVFTEMQDGSTEDFILQNPAQGLFIPTLCWQSLRFSHNAVLLSLCSMPYQEEDYIRSYEEYKTFILS